MPLSNTQINDFIKTKQDSKKHSAEDLDFFIKNLNAFSQEEITKWLKAVKANGLDEKETTALTMAMANSGTKLTWEGLDPVLDKHSTGGIGDKITLLFAPLLAAYGINIPKLSGRGLGITGGTIDKLESISGFRTTLTINEIKEQVKKIGLAICSASVNLAPADKKIYAIRDISDTIDPIPLIASSVMSKKIAGGAKNIVLDVKFGSGAFMKTPDNAKLLGLTIVNIGKNLDRNIKAVISDMNQPLGHAIGNVLEVKEVLEVLSGKKIDDLIELVISLAIESVSLIEKKVEPNIEKKLMDLLTKGRALKKFEDMVVAQGGDLKSIENKKARHIETIKSSSDGYIQNIDALIVGEAVHSLGAGRKTVSDNIDHSVGVVLHKKYSDFVKKDEPILEIHAKNKLEAENTKNKLVTAIKIGQNKPSKLKLVHEILK